MLRFPLDNQLLLDEWLAAIRLDEYIMVSQNTLICSEHFTDSDYVLENGSYELSSLAVPSKFDDGNESIEPINIGRIIPSNKSNSLQNWNNSPFINNVDKQVNIRDVQFRSSHTISSKNINKIIGGVNKTGNSSYNTSRINVNAITNNNKSTSHNNSSNEFVEDLFVDINQGDNFDNLIINSPSVYTPSSHNIKTVKTVVSNNSTPNVKPLWELNSDAKPKYKIPNSFIKKLKLLGQKNRRLCSKIKSMASRKQDLVDLQIKYIKLKLAVLETENKLLLNGVDTSEYLAFRFVQEDKETPQPKNIEYDCLLEYKLKELKNPKPHTDQPPIISPGSPTQVATSNENDTVIIL